MANAWCSYPPNLGAPILKWNLIHISSIEQYFCDETWRGLEFVMLDPINFQMRGSLFVQGWNSGGQVLEVCLKSRPCLSSSKRPKLWLHRIRKTLDVPIMWERSCKTSAWLYNVNHHCWQPPNTATSRFVTADSEKMNGYTGSLRTISLKKVQHRNNLCSVCEMSRIWWIYPCKNIEKLW